MLSIWCMLSQKKKKKVTWCMYSINLLVLLFVNDFFFLSKIVKACEFQKVQLVKFLIVK